MSTKQRLFQYGLVKKKSILWGLFFLILTVVTDISAPILASFIIDEQIVPDTINFKPLIMLLVAYLSLAIISALFRYVMIRFLQSSANGIIYKMRKDAFAHLQTLPVNYFDNMPAGKIVARITNDTEALRSLYMQVINMLAQSVFNIIGVYTAMFILNWKLASWLLLLLPMIIIWARLYHKYAAKFNEIVRIKIADINAMINESIQGMTIIQAFQREQQMSKEFDELNDSHYEYQRKLLVLDSVTSFNLIGVLKIFVLLFFVIYFVNSELTIPGAISIGTMYAFCDYVPRLFGPIQNIVTQFSQIERALAAGERIFEFMDTKGEPIHFNSMNRYEGNVVFDDVTFAYKGNEAVLKNISFTANKGETIALVGHTGSGKSSIINLLFRFYDPQEGKITIDGTDIKTVPKQMMREHMGIVLQDPYLFTGTIASNISMGEASENRDKIYDSLVKVGGRPMLERARHGLDEPVLEKGATFSSGERQLIAFARTLYLDPKILILDEATSHIDTETEELIQHAMEVVKEGRTTFIIAHRLSTIQNADQILVLDQGRIVERGKHEELLEKGGIYAQMYHIQQGIA